MPWDFNDIGSYFRQYAGPPNLAGAAGFFEWAPQDGFDLSNYPPTREAQPPTEDAPQAQADRVWVRVNAGAWQQLSGLSQVTNIGIGTPGQLTGGVSASIVIQGWPAKGVGFGYILGIASTLDALHADATQGILLVRGDISPEGEITVVTDWNEPFTAGDITAINAWMGAHGVTAQELASQLGWASPQEAQAWLLANPRKAFLQRIHDRFNEE